jgi:GWxTD domain-containing protein
LKPISNEREVIFAKNVLTNQDVEAMQRYFNNFWINQNEEDPEQAWLNYYERVKLVNKSYSTQVKKGYDTDRGRVFLQYGSPNHIYEEKHDPNAYPYDIWQYYSLNGQSDVKFVFFNQNLVGDDYMLLHSDLKGEIQTRNWDMIIHKRDTPQWNLDQQNGGNYFGGRSSDIFNK